MQSVVRVDPAQVKEWVSGLLEDQSQGKIEKVAYSPEQTTADVVNDTEINGLAGAVSERLSAFGFAAGAIGNNDKTKVSESQVQAANSDDLGAQAVAKDLGGLPIVADSSIPPGTVRVVLADDYVGPGSGLDGTLPTAATVAQESSDTGTSVSDAPPLSPVITAGSNDPKCVN